MSTTKLDKKARLQSVEMLQKVLVREAAQTAIAASTKKFKVTLEFHSHSIILRHLDSKAFIGEMYLGNDNYIHLHSPFGNIVRTKLGQFEHVEENIFDSNIDLN